MSAIGSISSALSSPALDPMGPLATPPLPPSSDLAGASTTKSFGSMLDGLVSMVSQQDTQANAISDSVMLGDSSQLHRSVIAMQEASVALSLMVQVRNKLVDSYQELMRMQV